MRRRVAVITGGAQGIGKVTAEVLAAQGWQVVALDADVQAVAEAQAEWQDRIEILQADIADETQVKAAIYKVIEKYNQLDALVNNAAISNNKSIEELTLEEWNRVLGVNLTGDFLMAKYSAPHLRQSKGSIVNIASTRAYMSEPNTEAYAASKGGMLALTHALAMSLGPEICVNSISPGWIDVSAYKKSPERAQQALSEADHAQHPAGRVGTPFDVAHLVVYLLSDNARFVTGQDFIVDGGMTRKMIYV